MRLEIALGGGDMNTLGAVPALATAGHLHPSQRIVVLPGAEGVELVAGAEESLHHDGVCRGGVCVVLAQELHQAWRVEVGSVRARETGGFRYEEVSVTVSIVR